MRMQLARIERVCRQQRKFQKIKLNIAFLQNFCPGVLADAFPGSGL